MSQSVQRAARLLLWLADQAIEDGQVDQGLKEMAAGAGLDKATAYRLAQALAEYGLVQHDEQTRRYRLGSGAMRLARAAMSGHAFMGRCLPVMKALSEATGETISLSERQRLESVTIYEIESRETVRYANTIGRSVPLHVAAGARAILAFSDERTISAALDRALEPYTPDTLTDPAALMRALDEVRTHGYAHSFGERTAGVHSLAIPLLDAQHCAVGSISILWPSRGQSTDEQRLNEWPALLTDAFKSLNDHYTAGV